MKKLRLELVDSLSDLERKVWSKTHDLSSAASCLELHPAFIRQYNEIYNLLQQLKPDAQEIANKSKVQFDALMVEYEQLGKPNKISDDSSRAYFKKRRLFADEFFASIMNLL